MVLAVAATLEDAFLRISRAEQHLQQLKRHLTRYVKANEGKALIKIEGSTATPIWPPDPPPILGVRVGEVVHSCRVALDYLVFQLAILDTGQVNLRTQFPIESTPEGFAARIPASKRGDPNYLTGVSPPHVAAIEKLQPYNGVDWTGFVRDISNEDKHRVIPVLGFMGQTLAQVGGSEEDAKALGGFRRPGDVAMYFPSLLFVTFSSGTPVKESMEEVVSETRAVLQAFEPDFK